MVHKYKLGILANSITLTYWDQILHLSFRVFFYCANSESVYCALSYVE